MYLHKTKNGHYTPPCCYFSGELEVVETVQHSFHGSVLKKIIKKIIDSSYFTAISSLGFKEVLGDNEKLIMSHNCSEGLVFCPVKKESGEKIRIVYWGMVRQADFNRRLIDLFGNDSRFEVP